MTFAQRWNRLTTRFSERIPVVKGRMTVHGLAEHHSLTTLSIFWCPSPPTSRSGRSKTTSYFSQKFVTYVLVIRYTSFVFMSPVPILEKKKLSLQKFQRFAQFLHTNGGKVPWKETTPASPTHPYTQTNVCHIRYMVVK